MNAHDPGVALLRMVNAYVALGMDPAAAKSRAMREAPHVARAYHAGELIPARQTASAYLRRVMAGDMVDGRPYLHKCSDEASGGGIFALQAA